MLYFIYGSCTYIVTFPGTGHYFVSTFILNLFIPIIQIQKIQMLDE